MSKKLEQMPGPFIRTSMSERDDFAESNEDAGLPTLQFWRADPRGRYGGKEGLETLPSNFNTPATSVANKRPEDVMRRSLEALRAAKESGYELPKEFSDSKFLAALAIKEGRSDFGANPDFALDSEEAVEAYNSLVSRFGSDAANFVGRVIDKNRTAKRTKLPFPMVWNGIGQVRNTDGTIVASGNDYNKKFSAFLKAAEHPKNAPLVNFINQYLNATEYTTPLPETMRQNIDSQYYDRRSTAYRDALNKLKESPLRQLQYDLFGARPYLGVPKEYDPAVALAAVPKPDYEVLRKQFQPTYKSGGMVENTTHDRKIL